MKKFIIAFGVFPLLATIGGSQPQRPGEKAGEKNEVVEAVGRLQPDVVDVSSAITGKIHKLHPRADWDTSIKKGEVLAEIDPARFQADAAIERARVVEAEAGALAAKARALQPMRDWERAKKLRSSGIVSEEEVEKSEAAAEIAKTALALAEAKVARCKAVLARAQMDVDACVIRSPVDGVIVDRRVNVGQVVGPSPGVPSLFSIAGTLKKLELWATVKERDIARIKKGQRVTFVVDALPKVEFKGRVTQIRLNAAMSKGQLATYTVAIAAENSDAHLLPYLTATVSFLSEGKP
jgi:HlyD family secretion protein